MALLDEIHKQAVFAAQVLHIHCGCLLLSSCWNEKQQACSPGPPGVFMVGDSQGRRPLAPEVGLVDNWQK